MREQEEKIIEIKDLWVSYDDHIVLKNINITIFKNDFLGIIGPNGGGKTTLLKSLLGILTPLRGSVNILGMRPNKARRYIGYVPQRSSAPQNFPITVFEVVRLGRYGSRGLGKRFGQDDNEAAMKALEKVEMMDYKDVEISKLSGGQQQRVFIARAIVNDPKLLLLDEPNIGIDVHVQNEFYSLLNELNKKMTILLITHDITAVSKYVKKIACLNKVLYYHGTKSISKEDFEKVYHCPVDIIAHGLPHWVLEEH